MTSMTAHNVAPEISRAVIDRPYSLSSFLDSSIAAGLLVTLFFTTLAHGAVEPWSVALFELMLVLLTLLWGIQAIVNRRLEVTIPIAGLPIAALLLLTLVQGVAFGGENIQRVSLSMDVEATRRAAVGLFFLAFAFVGAANFLAT